MPDSPISDDLPDSPVDVSLDTPTEALESEPPGFVVPTLPATPDVVATVAILGAGVYILLGLVKQALFRLDLLETASVRTLLKIAPVILGAAIAGAWLGPTVDLTLLGYSLPRLPSVLVGLFAGLTADLGYVWVRDRFPGLDRWTLTSEGPTRTQPLLGALVAEAKARQAERISDRQGEA